MAHTAKMEAATALLAASSSDGVSNNTPLPSTLRMSSTPFGGSNRKKKQKMVDGRYRSSGNTGGTSSQSANPPAQAPAQWTPTYNPWARIVYAWPMPQWRAQGVLGPCPGVAPTQAMNAMASPACYLDMAPASMM